MKRVHRALQLRPHKHTAKILPHRHTSYGALFVLMCVPVVVMALVGQFVAAGDYLVTATVPAPMPNGAPSITSPKDGSVTEEGSVVVSGTCPVIEPAVIIVIYNSHVPAGSVHCSSSGTFSVPVTLMYGANSLVATVATITGEVGQSSAAVTIDRRTVTNKGGPSSGSSGGDVSSGLLTPFYVLPTDLFVPIDSDGQVTWQGRLIGGKAPYKVIVDWGDGTNSRYDVSNGEPQAFVHTYETVGIYRLVVTAIDAVGTEVRHHTTTAAYAPQRRALLDAPAQQVHPIIGFVQRNAVQIYVFTLSGLIFLWYLEHGRHAAKAFVRQSVRPKTKRHR